MSAAATLREARRLPQDYLVARHQDRILQALAGVVVEKGYADTSVADIVKAAGCARNTFYETYPGKWGAAVALVARVEPGTELPLHPNREIEESGVDLFAVETAARLLLGKEVTGSLQVLASLGDLLDRPPAASDDDALLCTLPPGRHGLDREFVARNQRHRLLVGFAVAVAREGFPGATIADVCGESHLSRRTVYEHFKNREVLGLVLLNKCGFELPPVTPGIAALAVEVAAAWLSGQARQDQGVALVQPARQFLQSTMEIAG